MFAAYGGRTMRNAKFKTTEVDTDFLERQKRRENQRKWLAAIDQAKQAAAAQKTELERQATVRWEEMGLIVPNEIKAMTREICAKHGVETAPVYGRSRKHVHVVARNELFYRIKEAKPHLSFPVIGRWLQRDHTSIMHGVAAHAELTGEPKLTNYDVVGQRHKKKLAANNRYLWKEFQKGGE